MPKSNAIILLILLLIGTTLPLSAQDNRSHDVALQMIAEAAATQATTLSLSDLGLTAIPPEIGQLTQLEELYLRNNALSDVPPELHFLVNLRVIDLTENDFETLPPEIYMLPQLESLTLYYNNLTEVSGRIGRLTNLRFLGLSANELATLPPEIGQLTNLTELHIEVNVLQSLPPEIGNLHQLCVLHAYENQLTRLPAPLGQVTRLAEPECQGILIQQNPLVSPPPAVVRQGTGAILAYLRDEESSHLDERIISLLGSLAGIILLTMGAVMIRRSSQPAGKSKRKRDIQ